MRQKLKDAATSTNFWNNLSTIASLIAGTVLISFIHDENTMKEMVWAVLLSSGFHNAGNILAHMNKAK
jgi:hypothetical protein